MDKSIYFFINPSVYILCPVPSSDDTYMYDDAARGHWYDEPPYESDPDDFLMTGIGLDPAAATIQVSFSFIGDLRRSLCGGLLAWCHPPPPSTAVSTMKETRVKNQ